MWKKSSEAREVWGAFKNFYFHFLCKAAVVDFFCLYRLRDRIFLKLSPVYSVKLGLNFMK